MKKLTLLTVLTFLLFNITALAVGYYGNYTYGAGLYGINTPPSVLDFQPADTTPSFEPPNNETYNITYTDYDGDSVTLTWYVGGIFNQTGGNVTIYSPIATTYVITGNLQDWLNETNQTWTVTIEISTGNMTDVLILPSYAREGNTIRIYADVKARLKNFSNVNTTIKAHSDFFFISDTPRSVLVPNVYTNNYTRVEWVVSVPDSGSHNLHVEYMTENTTAIGKSEKVTVLNETTDYQIFIYIFGFIVFFILLVLGLKLENDLFITFSGLLLSILALYLYNNGFPLLESEYLKNTIVIIFAGIAFYLIMIFKIEGFETW